MYQKAIDSFYFTLEWKCQCCLICFFLNSSKLNCSNHHKKQNLGWGKGRPWTSDCSWGATWPKKRHASAAVLFLIGWSYFIYVLYKNYAALYADGHIYIYNTYVYKITIYTFFWAVVDLGAFAQVAAARRTPTRPVSQYSSTKHGQCIV